jgi:[ribosomal protein S5]-alanine N-acetyltransferase
VSTPAPLNWREGLPLLVTPRVVLRELRRSDAAALWRITRTPEVARYCWPPPPSVDAFEAYIAQAWRDRSDGKYAAFAVVPRDQTEPTGLFELRSTQPKFVRAELGLLFDPPAWTSGVVEDGMRLICGFAFRTVGVRRLEIRVSVEDARCNDTLSRLGVQKEAVLRSAFMHKGNYEDQHLWSVVVGVDRLAQPA